MSEDGPQGVFVNVSGYIHDILTFSKLSNKMRLRGRRETAYSWFPGYAWRIGECPTCGGHLGWKFNATEKKLVPAKFFAVLKNKIAWSMKAAEDVQLRPHS
jgi:cereblon